MPLQEALTIAAEIADGLAHAHERGIVHRDVDEKRAKVSGTTHHPSPAPEGAALWGFGASPAVLEGIVVVGSLDGKLYAFPAPHVR